MDMFLFRSSIEQVFGIQTLPMLQLPIYIKHAGVTNGQFGILKQPWEGKGKDTVLQAGNLYIILSGMINLMFKYDDSKDAVSRKAHYQI